MTWPVDHQRLLLTMAREAVTAAAQGIPLPPRATQPVPEDLLAPRACFVTLHRDGALRGCIGTLTARKPLAEEVVAMARAAAIEDRRFNPVTPDEVPKLSISISVLDPPEPLPVADEADLVRQLRPGVDGVILECGRHRGTFLPSVWDQLPEPASFVRALKVKAGLPETWWDPAVQIQRYTVYAFREDDPPA